ncbi:MAG: hypothetical protein M3069_07865 [Chloroflexota bacterium]|nr:hypothetical protein [Chloroflexota bacterium]
MQRLNIYRGHAASLSSQGGSAIKVHFRRLPGIGRQDIILPAGMPEGALACVDGR